MSWTPPTASEGALQELLDVLNRSSRQIVSEVEEHVRELLRWQRPPGTFVPPTPALPGYTSRVWEPIIPDDFEKDMPNTTAESGPIFTQHSLMN